MHEASQNPMFCSLWILAGPFCELGDPFYETMEEKLGDPRRELKDPCV
mgnify:CR=1 FL=1